MTPKNTSDSAMRKIDETFMKMALDLARRSERIGEVPVGAIVVDSDGKIVAKGTNLREKTKSVLGHAELVALHRANKARNSWRLNDLTLYVTLEPCLMCAAALVQSRIKRVVFATPDPKGGGLGSLLNLSQDHRLNHNFAVDSGICAEESKNLLQTFFRNKRRASKLKK